jgi:hypothetical protein
MQLTGPVHDPRFLVAQLHTLFGFDIRVRIRGSSHILDQDITLNHPRRDRATHTDYPIVAVKILGFYS